MSHITRESQTHEYYDYNTGSIDSSLISKKDIIYNKLEIPIYNDDITMNENLAVILAFYNSIPEICEKGYIKYLVDIDLYVLIDMFFDTIDISKFNIPKIESIIIKSITPNGRTPHITCEIKYKNNIRNFHIKLKIIYDTVLSNDGGIVGRIFNSLRLETGLKDYRLSEALKQRSELIIIEVDIDFNKRLNDCKEYRNFLNKIQMNYVQFEQMMLRFSDEFRPKTFENDVLKLVFPERLF